MIFPPFGYVYEGGGGVRIFNEIAAKMVDIRSSKAISF